MLPVWLLQEGVAILVEETRQSLFLKEQEKQTETTICMKQITGCSKKSIPLMLFFYYSNVKGYWILSHTLEGCSLSKYSDDSFQVLWLAAKSISYWNENIISILQGSKVGVGKRTYCNCRPLIWYPNQSRWVLPKEDSISPGVTPISLLSLKRGGSLSPGSGSATMQGLTASPIRHW